jgi:hypothetical protein
VGARAREEDGARARSDGEEPRGRDIRADGDNRILELGVHLITENDFVISKDWRTMGTYAHSVRFASPIRNRSLVLFVSKLFGAKNQESLDINSIIDNIHKYYLGLSQEEKNTTYALTTYLGRSGGTLRMGLIVVGNNVLKIYYYLLGVYSTKNEILIRKEDITKITLIHSMGDDTLTFQYVQNGSEQKFGFGQFSRARQEMDPKEWLGFISDLKKRYNVEERDVGLFETKNVPSDVIS